MKTTLSMLARILLVLTGLGLLVLCAGFFLGHTDALALWPWPDGRLSYVFVSSILAAIGAPVIWMGLSGELAAMRGGSLDFAVTYIGLSSMLLVAGGAVSSMLSVPLFLAITVGSFLFNITLFYLIKDLPIKDRRRIPLLLRGSFLIFFLLLVIVGTALVMRYPAIFPWPLKPQSSITFGWIFLGASVYFFYGFMRPSWGNACGQLLGFLAYDVILLVPFFKHLDTVKQEHQLSLYIYTGVLIYSALLSLYYLLIHSDTRLIRSAHNLA